jgi:KTSC domain
MGFRGWHGVTDPQHVLIAVSYEPVEGTLACKMVSGEPVIHSGVPEAQYQILLKSPFAGSHYRRFIRPKYPVLNPKPAKFKAGPLPEKKLPKVEYPSPQRDLFGTPAKPTS